MCVSVCHPLWRRLPSTDAGPDSAVASMGHDSLTADAPTLPTDVINC